MSKLGVNPATHPQLQKPSCYDSKARVVAGLKGRFTGSDVKNISALWLRFGPLIGEIVGQVGPIAYGLCSNMISTPFSFEYMAGVELSSPSGLPADFCAISIPAMRYAVFTHHGLVSNLPMTIDAIYRRWLPNSVRTFLQTIPDLPYMIERYDERFDHRTGSGDVELWIPTAITQ